ncbi:uncharacterized protein V6R79_003548 [Siganus canaliculatus]
MFRLFRVSVSIFPGLTDRPINLIYRVSPHPLTSSTGLLSNNELLRLGTIVCFMIPYAAVLVDGFMGSHGGDGPDLVDSHSSELKHSFPTLASHCTKITKTIHGTRAVDIVGPCPQVQETFELYHVLVAFRPLGAAVNNIERLIQNDKLSYEVQVPGDSDYSSISTGFELDAANNDFIYSLRSGLQGHACSDNQANKPEPNLKRIKAEKLIAASPSHGIKMHNYR